MTDRPFYLSRMLCFVGLVLAWSATARGQGIALSGVGPINRAMGGAATAAPLDAGGALHWNPASISGLPSSEVMFSLELLLADTEVSSQLGPFSGSTSGEAGTVPIPVVALVHKPCDSRWTFGLGMYGIAGFRVNYPARPDLSNPILSPQPPDGGLGVGKVFAEAEILQIAPTISYALTERLSVGISPTISMARLAADPLLFATPDADGRYYSGRGTRWAWGGGIQAGVYYIGERGWHWGASIKSPQWFEDFRFTTEDGQVAKVDIDYPMIISVGGAYSGFERWLLATDVRFFDYANTPGLGNEGYNPDRSLRGLGWSSVMSVHTGAQYKVNECLHVRVGYVFQQNPIRQGESSYNVASPLIIQHLASVGASYQLSRALVASVAYVHGFQNQVQGPVITPDGTIPNSLVGSQVSADALTMGFTVRY
jgi:long-chain fatty acid transport protein